MKRRSTIMLAMVVILISNTLQAQDLPPEIASVKPNEWIKGESLSDRIKTNEVNGNSIGVIYNYDENGSIFKNDAYYEMGAILVEKAKKYFKVANVELIDLSTIPQIQEKSEYKEYSWHNEYRWWDTKYKTVLYFYFKPDKNYYVYQKEEDDVPTGYYSTNFTFASGLEIFEFYQKKGKEKSKNLTSVDPIYLGIESDWIESYGPPPQSMKWTIDTPPVDDVIRIVENNMENGLSKWSKKKLGYSISPVRKGPVYMEVMQTKVANKPVDNESFVDKLSRIKEDDNRVAVVVNIHDIKGVPTAGEIYRIQNPSGFPEAATIKRIGVGFEKRLNESFAPDWIFQLVDKNKLPYGYSWQDTRYKIVIALDIYPQYKGKIVHYDHDNTYAADFKFVLNITANATEYFYKNDKPSESILTTDVNLGKYKADNYFMTNFPRSLAIEDLETECDRLRDEELQAEIERLIDENYSKLIEKLNK